MLLIVRSQYIYMCPNRLCKQSFYRCFYCCITTGEASRILKWDGDYDSTIPDISIAQFILDQAKEFGDEEACVGQFIKLC